MNDTTVVERQQDGLAKRAFRLASRLAMETLGAISLLGGCGLAIWMAFNGYPWWLL